MAVNCARALSKSRWPGRGSQRVLHVRAIGKSLGQVLESRDGLLVVFHEVRVLASMSISRQWKLLAEFESFAGGLLRLGVIAERRVGFGSRE